LTLCIEAATHDASGGAKVWAKDQFCQFAQQATSSIDVEIGSGMLRATCRSRGFERVERYELGAVAQPIQ
jgi:hypothetical protein